MEATTGKVVNVSIIQTTMRGNSSMEAVVAAGSDCLTFFFSSRRRHTRFDCDWVQTCALPISAPSSLPAGARRDCDDPRHAPRLPDRRRPPVRAGPDRLSDPAQHDRHVPVRRDDAARSEEHTSELQSQSNLVCRLLLEKKKKTK